MKKKSNLELDVEHTYRLTHSLSLVEKKERVGNSFSRLVFFSLLGINVCVCVPYIYFLPFFKDLKNTHTHDDNDDEEEVYVSKFDLSVYLSL